MMYGSWDMLHNRQMYGWKKCHVEVGAPPKKLDSSFTEATWSQVLQLSQNNINLTFDNYLNTMNALINSHAPLKKLNKKQRKFQQKPWGFPNSIQKKNRLSKKYIKCNNHNNKKTLHNEHKDYTSNLSTSVKQSKKLYYSNYLKNNIKDMKNIWKGIKSIISLKAKEYESPKTIPNNKGRSSPIQ